MPGSPGCQGSTLTFQDFRTGGLRWAKMAKQKDPELTFSHGHTKIKTIYRTPMKSTTAYKKRSSPIKDIKKDSQTGRRGGAAYNQITYPPGGQHTNQRITMSEALPEEQGV